MDESYFRKHEPFWGEWTIVRKLGEGSYGQCFEIEKNDLAGNFRSALKIITVPQQRDHVDSVRSLGMTEVNVRQYFAGIAKGIANEFITMERLKGNSNIVSYEDHSIIEHEDGIGCDILIRMELLETSNRHFQEHGVTEAEIVHLGKDICCALELCGKHNIIHRDIKPANIFLSKDNNYKLGDFGIAKTMQKTCGEYSRKGTPYFMAPEIDGGHGYDHRVDIFSLGVVMYYLLNDNRIPFLPPAPCRVSHDDFETALERRARGEVPPPPAHASPELARIILKACSFSPNDRYQTAQEMREDLEKLHIAQNGPEYPPSAPPQYVPSNPQQYGQSGQQQYGQSNPQQYSQSGQQQYARSGGQQQYAQSGGQQQYAQSGGQQQYAQSGGQQQYAQSGGQQQYAQSGGQQQYAQSGGQQQYAQSGGQQQYAQSGGQQQYAQSGGQQQYVQSGGQQQYVQSGGQQQYARSGQQQYINPDIDNTQTIIDTEIIPPITKTSAAAARSNVQKQQKQAKPVKKEKTTKPIKQEATKTPLPLPAKIGIGVAAAGVVAAIVIVLCVRSAAKPKAPVIEEDNIEWVVESYEETYPFCAVEVKYVNGERTEETRVDPDNTKYGEDEAVLYVVTDEETGKNKYVLYVNGEPTDYTEEMTEFKDEEWVIEDIDPDTFCDYAIKYVKGEPTEEKRLTNVYHEPSFYVKTAFGEVYRIAYVDGQPLESSRTEYDGFYETDWFIDSKTYVPETYEELAVYCENGIPRTSDEEEWYNDTNAFKRTGVVYRVFDYVFYDTQKRTYYRLRYVNGTPTDHREDIAKLGETEWIVEYYDPATKKVKKYFDETTHEQYACRYYDGKIHEDEKKATGVDTEVVTWNLESDAKYTWLRKFVNGKATDEIKDKKKKVTNEPPKQNTQQQQQQQQQQQEQERLRKQQEEQAKQQAEEQARQQAEEQARQQAEEQARQQAEEQARKQAEEQARQQAEEQARQQAEQERQKKLQEEQQKFDSTVASKTKIDVLSDEDYKYLYCNAAGQTIKTEHYHLGKNAEGYTVWFVDTYDRNGAYAGTTTKTYSGSRNK